MQLPRGVIGERCGFVLFRIVLCLPVLIMIILAAQVCWCRHAVLRSAWKNASQQFRGANMQCYDITLNKSIHCIDLLRELPCIQYQFSQCWTGIHQYIWVEHFQWAGFRNVIATQLRTWCTLKYVYWIPGFKAGSHHKKLCFNLTQEIWKVFRQRTDGRRQTYWSTNKLKLHFDSPRGSLFNTTSSAFFTTWSSPASSVQKNTKELKRTKDQGYRKIRLDFSFLQE